MDGNRQIPASLKVVAILFILGGMSAAILFLLSLWQYRVLTRPDVRRPGPSTALRMTTGGGTLRGPQ